MKTLRRRNSTYLTGELLQPGSNRIRGCELAHPKVKKMQLIREFVLRLALVIVDRLSARPQSLPHFTHVAAPPADQLWSRAARECSKPVTPRQSAAK